MLTFVRRRLLISAWKLVVALKWAAIVQHVDAEHFFESWLRHLTIGRNLIRAQLALPRNLINLLSPPYLAILALQTEIGILWSVNSLCLPTYVLLRYKNLFSLAIIETIDGVFRALPLQGLDPCRIPLFPTPTLHRQEVFVRIFGIKTLKTLDTGT